MRAISFGLAGGLFRLLHASSDLEWSTSHGIACVESPSQELFSTASSKKQIGRSVPSFGKIAGVGGMVALALTIVSLKSRGLVYNVSNSIGSSGYVKLADTGSGVSCEWSPRFHACSTTSKAPCSACASCKLC
jgi:hypothetical protein